MSSSYQIASAEDRKENIGRLIQAYSQRQGETQSGLLSRLREMSEAERIVDVERLAEGFQVRGDFEGCVNGEWQNISDTGAGVVKYKNKNYKAEPIGFVSSTRGLRVQLCHAQGKYFASF